MSLDLAKTAAELEHMAERLVSRADDRALRVERAMAAMVEVDAAEVRQKAASSQGRPYLCAGLVGGFAGRHGPGVLPESFCVASVDGSHIDVDRHIPVRCYLINVGGCLLTYGSHPDARLFSYPRLYSQDDDLYITNSSPEPYDTMAVQGPLLGLKRAVAEVRELVQVIERAPAESPVLALIDGSLVMWGLAGRGYPPFVRDEILVSGLIPTLDSLREIAHRRILAVAAYVSLPQTTEVVNTLRLHLCQSDTVECRQSCGGHRSTRAPCDLVNGFLDRHLFQELLEPGERSSTFYTNSSISREFYGPHQVHFYYINTGDEIARIEIPQWVAEDDGLLELSHTLVLDQCRRGKGYPAAIGEAHEQAVVTGHDRETFKQMVEYSLSRKRLPVYTSEKNRSKRMRWL